MKVLIKEDCYFFIDEKIPENIRPISALCLSCYEKNQVGWFWEGSKRGYYKYNINCCECGKEIYKIEGDYD